MVGDMSEQQKAPINLSFSEVHKILCPKCKKHLRSIVRDKIKAMQEKALDDATDRVLSGQT
jgi:hypothetical protein